MNEQFEKWWSSRIRDYGTEYTIAKSAWQASRNAALDEAAEVAFTEQYRHKDIEATVSANNIMHNILTLKEKS